MNRGITASAALLLGAALGLGAQAPQQPAAPPPTPKAAAPIDLTGYWVSVVTEDWRWRMIVPPKGDYTSVPLNPAGPESSGRLGSHRIASDGCKPFGAAAIMRVPGRVHITWDSDTVLKIETDAGRRRDSSSSTNRRNRRLSARGRATPLPSGKPWAGGAADAAPPPHRATDR